MQPLDSRIHFTIQILNFQIFDIFINYSFEYSGLKVLMWLAKYAFITRRFTKTFPLLFKTLEHIQQSFLLVWLYISFCKYADTGPKTMHHDLSSPLVNSGELYWI